MKHHLNLRTLVDYKRKVKVKQSDGASAPLETLATCRSNPAREPSSLPSHLYYVINLRPLIGQNMLVDRTQNIRGC